MPVVINGNGTITGYTPTVTTSMLPTGSVLQVQFVKDTSSTNLSQSGAYQWADISALTVNITPSATSSKILVLAHTVFSESYDYGIWFRVMRDSTPLAGAPTFQQVYATFQKMGET